MEKVLDASALLAFLKKGPGYEKVKDALAAAASGGRDLLMSMVNWGEVYYILLKEYGVEKMASIEALLATFPIEVVSPDINMTRKAASYKALQRLPYADSFAAALAKVRRAELLTCDKEFRAVEKDIRILWV